MQADWRETYADTEFTRKQDGWELPQTSPNALLRLCPKDWWGKWGGIRLSQCRCFYVLPTGHVILPTTIRKVLGQTQKAHESLSSYMQIPNGQVKNFLNACRASVGVSGPVRVAVVGSKSMEGGGTWHKYYALWLSQYATSVLIDFYDMSEIEDIWELEIGSVDISCSWICQKVSSKMIQEMDYNLVIDDVWTYEEGPGLFSREELKKQGKDYSLKGSHDSPPPFIPFLHSSETRCFSRTPYDTQISGCKCMTCQVCKECSDTYERYLVLRHLCSRLGFHAPCFGISWDHELHAIADIKKKMLTMPTQQIRTSTMIRYLMSLMEEEGVQVSGVQVRREKEPHFQTLSRFREEKSSFDLKLYPWLEGKSVIFCGVPATILGRTRITFRREDTSYEKESDVIFVNSMEVWAQRTSAPVVYCPVKPDKVSQEFLDWEATGRKVQNFFEYVRQSLVPPAPVELVTLRPHLNAVNIEKPVSLFPYVQSKVGRVFQRRMERGQLVSLAKSGSYIIEVPFEPQKWRLSLVVEGRAYSLLKLNFSVVQKIQKGFLASSSYLPMDITYNEARKYEDDLYGTFPQDLREMYKKGQKFDERARRMRSTRKTGMTMAQYFFAQVEFVLDSGNTLRRVDLYHPVMYPEEKKPIWEEVQDGGLQMYDQYVESVQLQVSRGVT